MGNNAGCILWPEASNGRPSRLYKELLKLTGDRPLANALYAGYLVSNVATLMDNAGLERDSNGEHKALDYTRFIQLSKMMEERSSFESLEYQAGVKDQNGKIVYTDAKVALDKAEDFNNNHTGVVANVYQYGNTWGIVLAKKDSRSMMQPSEVKERLQSWDLYKQVFNAIGIDIGNVPSDLTTTFSAYNKNLVQELQNLKRMSIQYLNKKLALTLFFLNSSSAPVQRLVASFGSIEDAAQAIDDFNRGISTGLTQGQKVLLKRAVAYCLQFQGLDLDALQSQISQITYNTVTSSPEQAIKDELHQLDKKYNIGIEEIHKVNDKIHSLSDAAITAALQLKRQLDRLKEQNNDIAKERQLDAVLNQLTKEIASKKYYTGLLNFMKDAGTVVSELNNMIANTPQTGSDLENAMAMAKTLQDIKDLRDRYYPLLKALVNPNLTIDESIGQADVDAIRQTAQQLKDIFDAKSDEIRALTQSTMTKLIVQIIGDKASEGLNIENVIQMASADSTLFDYLYSMGRVSNPILNAMGTITRNAQEDRNARMNELSLRIRRITDKLYKSGSNSEFMYEDEGHIISDIDWQKYREARKDFIKALRKQHLDAWDFKQAVQDWIEANTEEREVDSTNHRTERVPNGDYRKPFPTLTSAQQEYYDEMMQIKGEIGSLLPGYAQHHYLPPQLRRGMLDALSDAKDVWDVLKTLKNKAQDAVKIREDDEDYAENSVILDGEEYTLTKGNWDNTPIRRIPIFYVNRVEQGELLKDFSGGLTALASTAINYDAMDNVVHTVEFMANFVKDQRAQGTKKMTEAVDSASAYIAVDLHDTAENDRTVNIMNAFIAQQFYGQKIDPKTFGYKYRKLVSTLIAYTSFKGLATNFKGAFSNVLVGEFQMMIEAGAGEFYNAKDYIAAHIKLFGDHDVKGEISDLLTNNINSKATLFREMFDPTDDNFRDASHERYYTSMFRQLVAHDCSMIGYSAGEYLLHYVNMYATLNHIKALQNGKQISLYDAFEVTNKVDGNSELTIKPGVTNLQGEVITPQWLQKVKDRIRYVNQSTHGAMGEQDKGIIHQKLWGRMIMNFRQWMVEHYSRRFRGHHIDASLKENREGYWVSYWKYLFNDDTKDDWKSGKKMKVFGTTAGEIASMAIPWFLRDYMRFMLRAQAQWNNMSEMQRYNIQRVHSEMKLYIALLGLSFVLGEPDEHKKDFWRRWWIYQARRLKVDTEAALPSVSAISAAMTVLQSPMASINTFDDFLYVFYGLVNGDIEEDYKQGYHKGENKYWVKVRKRTFPFFKDIEQMETMDTDDSLFKVFNN